MIGKRIKRLRQEKGFSISELAKRADVSISYLSQIEREIQSNPSLQFLIKVSIPLETTIEYLLGNPPANDSQEMKLEDEWKRLIHNAIEAGLEKEDFREYLNFLRFQEWMKKQDK
ncbi:helix-turn-helix domain-containing protein [Neobacillus niacini]|uniref:helix-turn-helix domain-containing protein n=1 Tax=Neobacillus niacini TaxID=86668 RepID=UPI0021CB1475|nr:helix-turn-helix domain-containing protein [Neobacillus niacini]MCM3767932.1 helix-turn-helix domain-containing protein [Neobacillus niacini]